jgi:hypothetical protein
MTRRSKAERWNAAGAMALAAVGILGVAYFGWGLVHSYTIDRAAGRGILVIMYFFLTAVGVWKFGRPGSHSDWQ